MSRLSPTEPVLHADADIVNSTFGAYCEVGRGSRIVNSRFEAYAYCDRFADITNTTVGKFSNIAAMTRIGPTDHPFLSAAQHHFLYRSASYWNDIDDDAQFFHHRASRRTLLGPDCWIGHGAIIKPEITIGAGAIVAAGAVVTKDVPPFAIVGGVTATLIRYRFNQSVIDRLLALAWWEWSHEKLRDALFDFRSLTVEAFLEMHENTDVAG
jgi:phosphonate metabolism protein (transferase hexapeptide repeat family)